MLKDIPNSWGNLMRIDKYQNKNRGLNFTIIGKAKIRLFSNY